jgi:hypothetical protein
MKDFLFFNYSWVPNSTLYFKSFEKAGYSCDFVDENNYSTFVPDDKYRAVVVYLHCQYIRPTINAIIRDHCSDSFLIQHDDTDHEHVQVFTERSPDLIMQRELTSNTTSPYNCPIYPFHFPIPSMYEPGTVKDIDVVFYACMTNSRRIPFIHHVNELSKKMSHLKWDVRITGNGERTPSDYRVAINRAKIGLNYFGNSYDSWRTWELASAKTAIIMPKLIMKSVSPEFNPFDDYVVLNNTFEDLEEKILYTLENDRYVEVAERAFKSYNENHCPEKCVERYHGVLKKYLSFMK